MILVTGATGFIGSAFSRKLAASGRKVRILVRDPKKAPKIRGAEIAEGDLNDPDSLEKAARDVHAVVHLAGMVSYIASRSELSAANEAGTLNMLNACKKNKVKRFILASSVSVYGRARGALDESSPANPFNAYGESKLAAEGHVMESGMDYAILRFAPVYGAGSPQWTKSLRLLDSGFPIPDTKNRTHVLSLNNAVQALTLAVDGPEGTYNIADASSVPFVEFAEQLVRLLGKEPKRMPLWLVKAGAALKGLGPYIDVLTQDREYNIKRAQERMGYRPEDDFDAELKRMVKHYLDVEGAADLKAGAKS